MATSREIDEEAAGIVEDGAAAVVESASPVKIGSPELNPLPPLPRRNFDENYRRRDGDGNGKGYGDDEDEEFFSPRGSSVGGKENVGSNRRLSPVNLFHNVETDNFLRKSYNSSLNSSSRSVSVPNSPSPPLMLSPTSLRSKSSDSIIRFPVPLRPTLPVLPSPSLSSASSPPGGSGNTKNSPSSDSDFSELHQQFSSGFTTDYRQPSPVKLPPPPPPPLPPPMFWEIPPSSSLINKEPNLGLINSCNSKVL